MNRQFWQDKDVGLIALNVDVLLMRPLWSAVYGWLASAWEIPRVTRVQLEQIVRQIAATDGVLIRYWDQRARQHFLRRQAIAQQAVLEKLVTVPDLPAVLAQLPTDLQPLVESRAVSLLKQWRHRKVLIYSLSPLGANLIRPLLIRAGLPARIKYKVLSNGIHFRKNGRRRLVFNLPGRCRPQLLATWLRTWSDKSILLCPSANDLWMKYCLPSRVCWPVAVTDDHSDDRLIHEFKDVFTIQQWWDLVSQ